MDGNILLQNINVLWASLITDQLVRNGIIRFYLSPGNRNAPFLSSLAHNSEAEKHICIDERGAGYRGLGYARASGKPAVLVCTSGTALSNYFPALIEAYRDSIPLIVLSSDRPPELTGSDANQTIDQEKIFGRYVDWEVSLPPPSEEYPVRSLLSEISRLATCRRPVHLNCRFRDPLVPLEKKDYSESYLQEVKRELAGTGPHTGYRIFPPEPDDISISEIKTIIEKTERGLLVFGRMKKSGEKKALARFAETLGWPVFGDIGSSLKTLLPPELSLYDMDHPETLRLINRYRPETVLHLGYGLVSKHFYENILMNNHSRYLQVNGSREMQDPVHRVDMKLVAEPAAFIRKITAGKLRSRKSAAGEKLLKDLAALHTELETALKEEPLNHTGIASVITDNSPEGWGIFLGNSLPVRSFDRNIYCGGKEIDFIVNRGVSGIEGNIATALGYSEAAGNPVTAVIGDISFLHDMNSLTHLGDTGGNLLLVVINNSGGRIFERLPVMKFPEIIYPYSATPHGMDFVHLAGQFGIPYSSVSTGRELKREYRAAAEEISLQKKRHHFIEIKLSHEDDLRIHTMRNSIKI